ncbi:MAG: alpha/beta hydrolase-fold protein [Chitinophagaceae bacterium]
MKRLMPFMLLLLLSAACKKVKINPDFTRELTINSQVKNKDYHIKVQLPEDYYSSTQKYATIYVLDAFRSTVKDFEFVSKTCKDIAERQNTQNVIVVGIDYGDARENDYTPTATDGNGGEASRFTDFIEQELQPRIEQDFRADTSRLRRTIIGHSYGGLYGGYAFVKRNNVFGNYLLLSPSLWYDHEIILQYEKANRPTIQNNLQVIYLGVGGVESYMMPPIASLYQTLTKYYPNTKSSFEIVAGEGHMASVHKDMEKALNYYFINR